MTRQTFTDFVSLGGNCECGIAIQHAGQKQSHYFDFTNANATIATRVLEDEFSHVQKPEHVRLDNGMMYDATYGYHFYGDGPWAPEKLKHMIDRFMQPRGRRLYILKTPYETPYALSRLLDALGTISEDFELVHLRPAAFSSSPIGLMHDKYSIHERYLRRYAPPEDAGDFHAASWDALFAEFPLDASAQERGQLRIAS